jgi:hypothetical protein
MMLSARGSRPFSRAIVAFVLRFGRKGRGFKRFEDDDLACIEFFKLIQAVSDCGDGNFIKAARSLLSIAGDKRDGGFLFEKVNGGLYPGRLECEFIRDGRNMVLLHDFLSLSRHLRFN